MFRKPCKRYHRDQLKCNYSLIPTRLSLAEQNYSFDESKSQYCIVFEESNRTAYFSGHDILAKKCCQSTFKSRVVATKHLYSKHRKLTIDCHPIFIKRTSKKKAGPRLIGDWDELKENVEVFLKVEDEEESPNESGETEDEVSADNPQKVIEWISFTGTNDAEDTDNSRMEIEVIFAAEAQKEVAAVDPLGGIETSAADDAHENAQSVTGTTDAAEASTDDK